MLRMFCLSDVSLPLISTPSRRRRNVGGALEGVKAEETSRKLLPPLKSATPAANGRRSVASHLYRVTR